MHLTSVHRFSPIDHHRQPLNQDRPRRSRDVRGNRLKRFLITSQRWRRLTYLLTYIVVVTRWILELHVECDGMGTATTTIR